MSLISSLKSKNIPKFFELLQSPSISLLETDPKTNRTVLHLAILCPDNSILSSLLALPPPLPLDSEDYHGNTPLALAVEEGNYFAIEQLIKAGADVNYKFGGNNDR
jgi:ankyrin repeat protein